MGFCFPAHGLPALAGPVVRMMLTAAARPVGGGPSRGRRPVPWAAARPVGGGPSRARRPVPWAAARPVRGGPLRKAS
jgi:hypothetical protein